MSRAQDRSNQNLLTLQLLLRKLPECKNPQAQQALLSLIYSEAIPVAHVFALTLLKKVNLHKEPEEIDDLCHDAAARLITHFLKRPTFEMQSAKAYIFLMVQNELFNYQDIKFNQRHSQIDESTELIPAQTVLYGDDAALQESNLTAMMDSLCIKKREFIAYFGEAVIKNRNKTHKTRFKRAVLASQHVVPARFFYRYLDGLLVLENNLLGYINDQQSV